MKFITIIAFLLLVPLHNSIGQIKVDVKTKFNSKSKEMQAVKSGIIGMFETVNWLKLVDVGEKYSFWVKDLTISPNSKNLNQSIVKFNLSLNTPAMFSEGKVLRTRVVEFVVDVNEPLPIANPPELKRSLEKFNQSTNISGMEWLVASVSTGGVGAIGYLAQTITKVGSKFQSDYTPAQNTTGIWAGFYSLSSIYEMLKEQGEF